MKSKRFPAFLVALLGYFALASEGRAADCGAYFRYPTDAHDLSNVLTPEALRVKRASLQVPESVLRSIPSHCLLEYCENNPWKAMVIILIGTSPRLASEGCLANFNGARELVGRPDGLELLVQRYIALDPRGFREDSLGLSIPSVDKAISYIELLLATEPALGGLSDEDLLAVLRLAASRVPLRRDFLFGREASVYLLSGCVGEALDRFKLPTPSSEDYRKGVAGVCSADRLAPAFLEELTLQANLVVATGEGGRK
jgi:hypothetical protein